MKKSFFSSLLSLSMMISSASLSAEESATLTRTQSSGPQLEGRLEKAIYKTVPYQDQYEEEEAYQAEEQYTVDIPYQAEETYYEDIPYTDTETYYEDVPYQETESYYENIPYEETESYQDTETYYENEYRCRTVTDYVQECREERQCHNRPGEQKCQMVEECGTNAHGQPICKTRKVCEDTPGREECSNRQVCNSVPKSREECSYQQVPRTRTVTKYRTVTRYRQELRTRTVTKYRQEQRTRTVTKYRQELRTRTVTRYRQETRTRMVTKYRTVTKCCVTKYREEFDHTWAMNLKVLFPAQATLGPQETERFQATLVGSESSPQVDLQILESIYGYKVLRQDIKTTSGLIELALTPKYDEQSLGAASIERVELSGNDESLDELSLFDKGLKPRVHTVYRYRILEKRTSVVRLEGEVTSESAKHGAVEVRLAQPLSSDEDYVVQIAATRSGVVLVKSFSFTVTKDVLFQRWDPNQFGKNTLKSSKLNEQKDQTFLEFTDLGAHSKLTTTYLVSVVDQNQDEVWSQKYEASQVLNAQKKAKILLPPESLSLDEDLWIVLQVERTGKRLERPVQFEMKFEKSFVKLADLTDAKKIHSLTIQKSEMEARLIFTDDLKPSAKVMSDYTVVIRRRGGFLGAEKKVFAELHLKDSDLQSGQFHQRLFDLGVRGKDLTRHMTANSEITIDLKVTRKMVSTGEAVATINKNVTMKIQD